MFGLGLGLGLGKPPKDLKIPVDRDDRHGEGDERDADHSRREPPEDVDVRLRDIAHEGRPLALPDVESVHLRPREVADQPIPVEHGEFRCPPTTLVGVANHVEFRIARR